MYRLEKLLFVVLITASFSCTKEKYETLDIGSGGVTGIVRLHNYLFTTEPAVCFEGIKVTLLAGDDQKETNTNDIGLFCFDDIPTGTYIINFEKEDYIPFMVYNVTVLAGAPTLICSAEYPIPLFQIPDITIDNIASRWNYDLSVDPYLELTITASLPEGKSPIERIFTPYIAFVGRSESINSFNYESIEYLYDYSGGIINDNQVVTTSYIRFPEYERDEQIFLKIHTLNNYQETEYYVRTSYTDPETGDIIITNMGEAYPETISTLNR